MTILRQLVIIGSLSPVPLITIIMKLRGIHRGTFRAILSGTYSQAELYEFVQTCYALALPCIRKKIMMGKINLDVIGLREADIVQDCLADLFRRDDSTVFPEIRRFFNGALPDPDTMSEEHLLLKLRQLVLGKCNTNMIRLYAEADPTLGKIIRNMTLAIDRTQLFEKCSRFGEAHIAVRGLEVLSHLPPAPGEWIRERLLCVARSQDTIPQMLRKLHTLLGEETEYQRTVPLVGVALIFKEVYAGAAEATGESSTPPGDSDDVHAAIKALLAQFENQKYRKYVSTGKCSARVFQCYMLSLREFLTDTFVDGDGGGTTYYEYLKRQMPDLTKAAYLKGHRSVYEYLAKTVKGLARKELEKTLREDDDMHVYSGRP